MTLLQTITEDISSMSDLSLPSDPGLEVYVTEGGLVGIRQEDPMDDAQVIVVSPERVDRLVEFLRIAKDEILTARADDAAAANERPPLMNG